MKHSFEPVIYSNSRILILGTMPGDESIRLGQYYANPRNQFWTILSRIYNQTIGSDYQEKLNFLKNKRLALWDVLRQAERQGSTDNNIRLAMPNDFSYLFSEFPSLIAVAFNGNKAHDLFFSQVLGVQRISLPDELRFINLPSTSPMRTLPLTEKYLAWKQIATIA